MFYQSKISERGDLLMGNYFKYIVGVGDIKIQEKQAKMNYIHKKFEETL